MKRIFVVTGGCGHLGSTIVRKLLDLGARVRALALNGESTAALTGCEGVEVCRGDVCDAASLEPLFRREEGEELCVIHTAALISIESKVSPKLRAVNVGGVKNIVEACLRSGARLVHVSSVHALPEQPGRGVIRETDEYHAEWVKGAYAKTKAEAAQYVLDAVRYRGLNASIVLPAGILGPGDWGRNLLNHTVRDCVTGRLRILVNGGYNFVDVRDVADACIAAVDAAKPGESYILGSRHYEWRDVAAILKAEGTGADVRSFLSPSLLRPVAPFLELGAKLKKEQPLFTGYSLYCMRSNDNFSSRKARENLGFSPRSIEETLRDTAAWELCRAEEEAALRSSGKTKKVRVKKKKETVPA